MDKGKVISLISIKGGTGKTTSVINIAHSLASDYGKKVLVVDTNFSSPNILLHLGNIECKNTLNDVISQKVKPKEAVYESQYGFHFMSTLNLGKVNHSRLKAKIQQLKKDYDVILLDSSSNLSEELLAAMSASDELYVVSTPDLSALSTTLRAVKLALERKTNINGLILNKVRGKNYEIKPSDMERLSGIPLIGVVKDSVRVLEALNKNKPITALNPDSEVSLAYKKIAAKLVGAEHKELGFYKKVVGNLKDDFSNLATHNFTKGFTYFK